MITLCAAALLAFDTGYQYDQIDATVEQVDTAMVIGYGSDLFQYSFLSYQFGGHGTFITPANLILKLAGHFGAVLQGDYSDDDGGITGKLIGYTVDGMGSMGISFPIDGCFSFIPLFGYSYTGQSVEVRDSASFDPTSKVNNAEDATWESVWYGPWVGFDIAFGRKDQKLNAGYEFHFGSTQTSWSPLEDPTIQSYPYQTFLKNMFGHTFQFEGSTPFRNCWSLGGQVHFTIWSNVSPVKATIPPPDLSGLAPTQIVQMRLLSWHSYEATLTIGREF